MPHDVKEVDYSMEPDTPLHPKGDEEVSCGIPDIDEDFDMDLNPELEDSSNAASCAASFGHLDGDRPEDFRSNLTDSPFHVEVNRLAPPPERLSLAQQSKFINYVDDRLMSIQRRFVQSHGLNETGYESLVELLMDLKALIDFVWFSIDTTTALRHESYKELPNTNFGQTEYLIRIANDILDYVERYKLEKESVNKLFKFIKHLDTTFARILDGNVPGGKGMNGTERVRTTGIAERSRLAIASIFEDQRIDGYHYELSKIYEQVLERTT